MSDLPDPPVPPDCDLRGMSFMPLDIVRLLDSDFYALATPEEFRAGFTLWCRSFLQVPAGSLPNDDRILAHLSGAGSRWSKVREASLRNFHLCSDGRLYHSVVAEKAKQAWETRQSYRARTEAARQARQANRDAKPNKNNDEPDNDPGGGGSVTVSVTDNVTECAQHSDASLLLNPRERERERERERDIRKRKKGDTSYLQRKAGALAPVTAHAATDGFDEFWNAYPRKIGKGQARRAYSAALRKTSASDLLAAVRRYPFNPDLQYVKYPSAWLNGECWLDEQTPDSVLRVFGINGTPQLAHETDMQRLLRIPTQDLIAGLAPDPTRKNS